MAKQNGFLAGSGAVWVQPDGPNSQPYYLGCHSLGSFERSRGDVVLVYKPDVEQPNTFLPIDIYRQDGPGPVTSSINFVMQPTADWLEGLTCPVPFYIHKVDCGRMDVFEGYSRTFILENTLVTNETSEGLTILSPDNQDRSMQSFDLASQNVHRIFPLSTGKQNLVGPATRVTVSIDFVGPSKCRGQCGGPRAQCEVGYVGLEGQIGVSTNVYWTEDGGQVWYPTATNPFQSHEDVSGVVVVQYSRSIDRLLVARGVLDGLNPMEIAYSDDQGATWTNVDVGSVNGQYAIGRGNCLWAHNGTNIWLVTTGGYIYYSKDAGVSWTAQESGATTVQDLRAVHFADDSIGFAVGDNNTILKTFDGETWTSVIGPGSEVGNVATCVHVFNRDSVWVGYDSGRVWFTRDGGDTWYERVFPGSETGEIQDLRFCSDFVGYILQNSSGGTVGNLFRTINGGWSWRTQVLPSATGPLYALHVCNCNNIYAVGDL